MSAEVENFVRWMKQLGFPRRTRVEAMLRYATPAFVASEADREAFDLAGWDELRLLDPSIVTVGSHSMTHPVLPSMSAGEIESELAESRRLIEAKRAGRPNSSLTPTATSMSVRSPACAATIGRR